MTHRFSRLRHFLSELRRRNVYQVAGAYLLVAFVALQLADLAAGAFRLPGWFEPMVWTLCGLGFPIALVLAWALEVTPEGVRVEETASEEEEVSRPTSTTRDLWVGASVLVLLLLGAWWMWGGLGDGGADQARSPGPQERSIAVLPFEVSGSVADTWRDGMVTALSLNLDGTAGLRAVADRTIFATWQKRKGATEGATVREALSVAREVGAKYALVGSAVQLGEDLRLAAEVRRTASGERLGRVEARGSPEQIPALVDRLTRNVLVVLLEKSEEQVPSVDLASITTSSLEALKAFLNGEQRFRAGDYEEAIRHFKTAVRQDSTFALAYARLAQALSWFSSSDPMRVSARQRAYELSDRLPRRERRLVKARHLFWSQLQTVPARDTLRRLTKDYPDDPSVWYELGEVLYHYHVPEGWAEAEEVFREAVGSDPGIAQYHHHLVDLAFSFRREEKVAAERVRAHPPGEVKTVYQWALDLVFGPAQKREAVLSRLDTVSISRSGADALLRSLRHPTDGALAVTVLRRLLDREDLPGMKRYKPFLLKDLLKQGQVREALTALRDREINSPFTGCVLMAEKMLVGLPIPSRVLDSRLDPGHIEAGAPFSRLICAGMYLIEEGRSGELPSLYDRVRRVGDEQGVSNGEVEAAIDETKGLRAWKEGRLEEASRLWSRSNYANRWGAIWRGDLYRKLGRLEKAEGWYRAGWSHPVAHERLGQLYEEMGKPKKARAAYERFVEAWKGADPELQPRVQEARRRLEAVSEKKVTE